MAEQIEPGDQIVFYVTGVQAFGGIVRVTSEMFEDREKVWPGKPGKADAYPWRFETEPVLVLDEDAFVPAEDLAAELEHVAKWPAEHWHLAFQGQLRTVSEADARLLADRIARAAAPRAGVSAASAERAARAPLHRGAGQRGAPLGAGADRAAARGARGARTTRRRARPSPRPGPATAAGSPAGWCRMPSSRCARR